MELHAALDLMQRVRQGPKFTHDPLHSAHVVTDDGEHFEVWVFRYGESVFDLNSDEEARQWGFLATS